MSGLDDENNESESIRPQIIFVNFITAYVVI